MAVWGQLCDILCYTKGLIKSSLVLSIDPLISIRIEALINIVPGSMYGKTIVVVKLLRKPPNAVMAIAMNVHGRSK